MASLVAKRRFTVLPSASRTTTQTTGDYRHPYHRGVKVVLTTSAIGTGDITLTIQEKNPTSGAYTTLLAGTNVTTNTTNTYTVFPGSAVSANVSANNYLPRTWRVVVTANNANAATYVVYADLLP